MTVDVSALPTIQTLLSADETAIDALLAGLAPPETAALLQQLKQEIDSGRAGPRAPALVALAERAAARHPDHPDLTALAAWIAGNAAVLAGEWAAALTAYECATAAYRAIGDEYSVACLRVGEMGARLRLGQRAEARAVAREIAPVLRAHNDQLRLASIAANLGALALEQEQRPATALRYYTHAARRYHALGRSLDVARMLLDSAYALIELDDFRRARRRLLAARRIFESNGVASNVYRIEMDLGVLEARRGRYNRALRYLHAAQAGFEALGYLTHAAVAEADLYRAYLALNCADEVVARAETPPARLHGFDRHALTLDLIAAHQQRGDHHAARLLLSQFRRELGDDPALAVWRAQAALEAATLALDGGRPEEAAREALRGGATLRAQRRIVPAALADLIAAAAYLELGQSAEAASLVARADAVAGRLSRPLAWRAAALAARLAQVEGRWSDAAAHLERAIAVVETLRGNVPLMEWRASFLDDKVALYADRAALALITGDPVEAWTWVERGKARALAELLAAAPGGASAGGAASDRELARLEEEIHWLEQRLVEADWATEAAPHRRQTERRLAEAYRRLRLLEGESPQPSPWEGAGPPLRPSPWEEEGVEGMGRGARYDRRPAREGEGRSQTELEAVRTALAPGEALVEFMIAGREERLSAFVITHDTFHVATDLGRLPDLWETLAGLLRFDLDDFRASLPTPLRPPPGALEGGLAVSPSSPSPDASAVLSPSEGEGRGGGPAAWQARTLAHLQALYAALLAPLTSWLEGSRRLLVVPAGQLFYVPFHALHDGAGFVADRWEVRYAPSALSARLCAARATARPEGGTPLVAGVAAGGTLPHVYEEVRAVAATLPGARCLLDEAVTPEALRRAAPGVSLLHLAAHAEFRADNPLFSSLRLGAGRRLHVYAIGRLQLARARLVTLSACETGMSAVQGGDLLGLVQGFFAAGAPSLVVSLWPVLDAATAPLMVAFYRRLVAGEGKAAALRAAQQEIRTRFSHPYLWAPFILLGDAGPLQGET